MKRTRLWAVLLLCCLISAAAWAETFGPTMPQTAQTQVVYQLSEKQLTLTSASWLPNAEAGEAYLFAEITNETNAPYWIDRAHVYGYDAAGTQLFEETYASVSKRILLPGESAYLDEWLRSVLTKPEQLATVEIVIEPKEYHNQTVKPVCEVIGEVKDGAIWLTIVNPSEETVFDVCISGAAYNAAGEIVCVISGEIGYYVGIPAGGSIVFVQKLPKSLAAYADGPLDIKAQTYTYVSE